MTKVGSWLMLRTLSLRVAIMATVFVVTAQGAVNLAAHQLAMTSLHVPRLRAGRPRDRRAGPDRQGIGSVNPGNAAGPHPDDDPLGHRLWRGTGALLALVAPFAGALFTSDAGVQSALMWPVGAWPPASPSPATSLSWTGS